MHTTPPPAHWAEDPPTAFEVMTAVASHRRAWWRRAQRCPDGITETLVIELLVDEAGQVCWFTGQSLYPVTKDPSSLWEGPVLVDVPNGAVPEDRLHGDLKKILHR